jgi:starvation-inducible DNA-binding protein
MQKVQVYLSNLAVMNVKLHNLHWNVVGKNFVQLHEFTEEMYDGLFKQFDDVAELLKMRNVFPASSLAEYLKLATLEELPAKAWKDEDVIQVLFTDVTKMLELARAIREDADAANDYTMVAAFEDIIAAFEKNLWFIRSIQG